jgi:LPXTG-motif cell wall-anchored protein
MDEPSSNKGLIIGGTIGIIVLFAAIGLILYQRRKRTSSDYRAVH